MDEYLWNKTGSDPEIEKIEASLRTLAYRPTAPPVLPAKQFEFAVPRPSFFRFSVSFAAAALALLAFGTGWILLRNGPNLDQQAGMKVIFQPTVEPIQTEASTPMFTESPKASAPMKPRRRPDPTRPATSNAIRPQTLVLTKEEADAYRQLMTALTITSTNLKIVKDKLDGTE
jgi:hypothetical protein